jgi:nitrite reductase/ring-hydroxylating ferredoxin subunit
MKYIVYHSLRKTTFLIILTMLLASCENSKNDVIPDVYVYFTIDLSDPQFLDLTGIGGSAYVSSSTNNFGSVAAGYDNNGIIVHCGADNYYAYDRTCPHDFVNEAKSVKVNIDFVYAICPSCSTKYALTAGGTPASGPGKYPLKNYRTSFDGRFVTVWND